MVPTLVETREGHVPALTHHLLAKSEPEVLWKIRPETNGLVGVRLEPGVVKPPFPLLRSRPVPLDGRAERRDLFSGQVGKAFHVSEGVR